MMNQTASFRFGETNNVQVLEMPYRGGEYAMMIVHPKDRAGLGALDASISVAQIAAWRATLSEQRVQVSIPRFTIDGAKPNLGALFQAMGMRRAFSSTEADFSNMARPPNAEDELYIAAAIHEAVSKWARKARRPPLRPRS